MKRIPVPIILNPINSIVIDETDAVSGTIVALALAIVIWCD